MACTLLSTAGMWLLTLLTVSTSAAPPLDAARLARLFGFGAQPRTPPPPSVGSSADQSLPRLLGTLRSTRTPSLASLEHAGKVRTVAVGDEVGAWRLEAMPSPWCVTLRSTRGAVDVCASASDRRPGNAAPARPLGSAPTAGGVATIALTRAELARRIHDDAERVLGTTRVVPHFRGGQLAGFTLHFPADSPLRALGLEPKDTILTVDGQPLTPTEAARLWTRWQELRSVAVELERGGVIQRMRLSLE